MVDSDFQAIFQNLRHRFTVDIINAAWRGGRQRERLGPICILSPPQRRHSDANHHGHNTEKHLHGEPPEIPLMWLLLVEKYTSQTILCL
jgi:hypothetical protein